AEIAVLLVIATLGHVMAFTWYLAARQKWKICERTIYDLPINEKQMAREFRNSLHTPLHAVILAAFLWLGVFQKGSWTAFLLSFFCTTKWAEIWHYASPPPFHSSPLSW